MLYRLEYKPSSQSENHLRESASEQRQSLFFSKINIHCVIHSKFLHKGRHMHSQVLQTAGLVPEGCNGDWVGSAQIRQFF